MENISKLSKDYLSNLDPVYRKNSLIHIEFVTLGSLYIGTRPFHTSSDLLGDLTTSSWGQVDEKFFWPNT